MTSRTFDPTHVTGNYVLIGQTPVPEPDLLTWARWFDEPGNRRVMETVIAGTCRVSTIFLGLDHRMVGKGPPLLFETMAFWASVNGGHEQMRCSTWQEAESQHARMVAEVSRLRPFIASIWRRVQDYLRDAKFDLWRHWRELQGIPPTILDQLSDLSKNRRDSDGW